MPFGSEQIVVPLTLVGGTLCDARVFAPLLARLAPGRAVHAVPLPPARSIGGMADALLTGAPRRFALLGFSLGAIVALEAALTAPDRIRALALVGGTARPVPPAEHQARRSAARGDVAAHVRRNLLPLYAGAHDDTILAMARDLAVGYPDQTEAAITRPDRRADLSRITAPTLVAGGMLDGVNPPAAQRALAAAIPGATLALIPGAGHFTPLDAPDALAVQITAWLDRADANTRVEETA